MTTIPSAARNVLVVDDDRTLRHAITTLLQHAGYGTDQAGDGPEALRTVPRQPASAAAR